MSEPLLAKGYKCDAVADVQTQLNTLGYSLPVTGYFGDQTEAAVKDFQSKQGLGMDGMIGPKTRSKLFSSETPTSTPVEGKYAQIASRLGCEEAAVRAVLAVESKGSGFLPDGRISILFERHVFDRKLSDRGFAVDTFREQYPDIVNPKAGGYKGGAAEWDRLELAKTIDEDCALESASYGLFQVMGKNWKALGYRDVQDLVQGMSTEDGQIEAFARYVEANPLVKQGLTDRNWVDVARGYNGAGFANNAYDQKLKAAYDRYV